LAHDTSPVALKAPTPSTALEAAPTAPTGTTCNVAATATAAAAIRLVGCATDRILDRWRATLGASWLREVGFEIMHRGCAVIAVESIRRTTEPGRSHAHHAALG
jgi:hypothetical protein